MQLASRFASRSPVLRSERPLSDDQIRAVAPSIFAEAPHESRSERYSYIPTATVLQELRGEGFEPFMVTQTRVRHDDRRDLWSVFNRTQENLTKGGLSARAANGRRQTTRPVQGIDQSVRLNRALWLLADGLRQLKA